MVFVDISGFTSMSERLARQGRIGAEETTDVIATTLDGLQDLAGEYGGSLLKFGGDALLLFFKDVGHALRAADAARAMQLRIHKEGSFTTSAGQVTLRMSVGAHSDVFAFFRVGESHSEMIVAGPAVTGCAEMERIATAGQIVVSDQMAALLGKSDIGEGTGAGRLLRGGIPRPGSARTTRPRRAAQNGLVPVALQQILESGEVAPEHRPVAVAFVRYSGFDSLLQNQGITAATEELHELVADIQRAVDPRGVAFLASDVAADGGKVILTAGAPTVSGLDEELMLLALREIVSKERHIGVHIGATSGHVFAGVIGTADRKTYTVMGDAVNLSARLAAKAEPGQILSVPDLIRSSRTTFALSTVPPFLVKGKKRPIEAVVVGEVVGVRESGMAGELPLLGRRQEIEILGALWKSAADGDGRVAVITGQPGLGKTRIVQELVGHVGGSRVIEAGCRLYQAATPYFPFRSLIRQALELEGLGETEANRVLTEKVTRLVPELLPWLPLIGQCADIEFEQTDQVRELDDQLLPVRTGEAVETLLTAFCDTPSLLIIEDAHWMDESSRELLSRIASGIASRPWLLCVTGRDGASFPPSPGWTALTLEPLSSSEAKALIEAATQDHPILPQDAAALAERAQGSPLFLIELLAALRRGDDVASMPGSVERLIHARIDRLIPADRDHLRRLSVLGLGFAAEHMATVLGKHRLSPGRVLARVADFVTVGDSGWIQFNHALIRDAAYEGLAYQTRRHLHSLVADSIQADAINPDEEAEILSIHLFNASRWSEAERFSLKAAEEARAIYANREAATFYKRAIICGRKLGNGRGSGSRELWEKLGSVLERAGSYIESGKAYAEARRRVTSRGVDRARLLRASAMLHIRQGQFESAIRVLGRALWALGEETDRKSTEERSEILSAYATALQSSGRSKEAVQLCRRALIAAEDVGSEELMAHSYYILDWALFDLGEEAHQYSETALDIYRRLGNLPGEATVLNNLGMFSYFEGDWNAAVKLYADGADVSLRTGDPVGAAFGWANLGEILVDQGQYDRAEEVLREALQAWGAAGNAPGVAFVKTLLGRVALGRGEAAAADRLLADALQQALAANSPDDALEAELRSVESLLAQAEIDRFRDTATALESKAAASVVLDRLVGYSYLITGDLEKANERFLKSLGRARAEGSSFHTALALAALADAARARNMAADPSQIAEMSDVFQRLGVIAVPPYMNSGSTHFEVAVSALLEP
jgi:class 3 adenylate cyclase/tetratricopeptide (TPR) repeat protein